MTDVQQHSDPVFGPAAAGEDGRVRLYGPQFDKDPGALYAEIRRTQGPVAPVMLEGEVPAWLVCGYRELLQVTSDAQLFARDSRRWNAWDSVPEGWPPAAYVAYNQSILFTEGAEHRRRSGAVSDALDAVDRFELANRCEQIADELIDSFAGAGEADLMAQYAATIPLAAGLSMCGMAAKDTPRMIRDVQLTVESSGQESLDAFVRVQQSMAELVATKRANPGADVPSRLLAHPANLTDEEIASDVLIVVVTAQLPTTNWIGNTIRLLLTDERFATIVSGGRASVGQALNDVLWQDTPTQNMIGRWASRDTTIGGQRVRAGDLLVLGLAAANSDPQVRQGYDGSAGNRAQLSFSHGEHGCPYPAPELADVIARTSIEVLLDRLPDLTLAVPIEQLKWQPSVWMRGLVSLPVQFTSTYVR
jgi:cytochrome P450